MTQLCPVAAESFIVCKGFMLPAGMSSSSLMAQFDQGKGDFSQRTPEESVLLPFLMTGDLNGWWESLTLLEGHHVSRLLGYKFWHDDFWLLQDRGWTSNVQWPTTWPIHSTFELEYYRKQTWSDLSNFDLNLLHICRSIWYWVCCDRIKFLFM